MKIALLVSGIICHKKESLAITTINFAKELIKEGHDVKIIARKKNNTPSYEEFESVKIYRIKGIGKLSVYNKLLCFPIGVKMLGPFDIIHSFSSSPALVLRGLLSKWLFNRKAKVVHTLKSYPVSGNFKNKNWKRFLFGKVKGYWLLKYANLVTVSTNIYSEKLNKKGVVAKKINSHIDLEKFKFGKKEENEKKIVFYYGGMWDIKGINYLIEAMPKINAKFIFAPRNLEALEEYSDKMKGDFEFIMNGKIEEQVFKADVVVMPYPHLEGTEANPSCILESLASGTPIVTTAIPELLEVFYGSVVFANVKDSDSLAEKINYVLENDVSEFVNNGLELVKDFSIDKVTKEFIDGYNQLRNK